MDEGVAQRFFFKAACSDETTTEMIILMDEQTDDPTPPEDCSNFFTLEVIDGRRELLHSPSISMDVK